MNVFEYLQLNEKQVPRIYFAIWLSEVVGNGLNKLLQQES